MANCEIKMTVSPLVEIRMVKIHQGTLCHTVAQNFVFIVCLTLQTLINPKQTRGGGGIKTQQIWGPPLVR